MSIFRQAQSQTSKPPSRVPLVLALPPLVVLRRELGYELMHPGRLLVAAGLLVAVPYAINLFYGQRLNITVLVVFAVIIFAMGLYHRQKHWGELAAGESKVHSLETGYSILASALPAMPRWTAVCVDPLACIAAGYAASYISAPFGVWVMLSGGALGMVEWRGYRDEKRRFIATHDGMREAERHGTVAEKVSGKRRAPPQEQSTGTATGMDADLEWHLSQQRD